MPKFSKIILLIGLLGCILVCNGCSPKTVRTTEQIQTLPASIGSIRKTITFVGNVTSGQSSEPAWGTSGVIESVNVQIGDTVTEGQILATLERDSLTSSVLNAEIPLISAQEELDEVFDSETPKAQAYKDLKDKEYDLNKAEKYQESLKYPHAVSSEIAYWADQIKIYKEIYDDAQSVLDDAVSWKHSPNESDRNLYEARRKAMLSALSKYAEVYNSYLYYSGTATDNQVSQAGADIDTAQAEYEKALKNFLTYAQYPREKDIAAAQLKVDNAQNTYNQRNIVADINGVVTSISAREGDYVSQNSAAFRLDNMTKLYIPIDVSEIDIISIRNGMRAQIVLDANTEKVYEGIVTTISASGDSSESRVTFGTLVEILDPDENVKIGMTAEVNLLVSEVKDVLLVPSNAVFTNGGVTYVSVSDGKSVFDVPVTVGLSTETVTEISGGYLKKGDAVCVPSIDNSILKDLGLNEADRQSAMENAVNSDTENGETDFPNGRSF